MFNIDIPGIVFRNTVNVLRKAVNLAYRRTLLSPIATVELWFDELRSEIYEEYRWNGLIHSLEKLLNDRYDPVLRRIYINVNTKLPVWSWKDESEQADWYWKDQADTPDWYWLDEDTFNTQQSTHYEFSIYFHGAIPFVPEEILRLVQIYRYAGHRPRLMRYGPGIVEEEEETNYYPG